MLTVRRVLLLPGAGVTASSGRHWRSTYRQIGRRSRLPGQVVVDACAGPTVDVHAGATSDVHTYQGSAISPTTPPLAGSTIWSRSGADSLLQRSDRTVHGRRYRAAARGPISREVRRPVLIATSGGFDLAAHDAEDWRHEYRRTYSDAATWITKRVSDAAPETAAITAYTLLLWGDHDPISPISVGTTLAQALRHAHMHMVAGGTHNLAHDQPDTIAPWIIEHLR